MEISTRPLPSAVNKQLTQPAPVAKTPAAPHWMTVRDNPSLPPASSGTAPQAGTVGSLMSRMCSSHPRLASAWNRLLPGHVDIPDTDDDDDDDDFGDQGSSGRQWLSL